MYVPQETVTTTSHGPIPCKAKKTSRSLPTPYRLCSSFDLAQQIPLFRFLCTFRLREKHSLSASEAAKRSRDELQDGEEKAQIDLVSIWSNVVSVTTKIFAPSTLGPLKDDHA